MPAPASIGERNASSSLGIPYSVSLSEVAASAAAEPTLAVSRTSAYCRTGPSFAHSHASLRRGARGARAGARLGGA